MNGLRLRIRRTRLAALILAALVLAALAIGIVALVSFGHGATATGGRGASARLTMPACPKATVVGSAGRPRYVTVARGTIAGEVWSFRERFGASGPAAGFLGRLGFDGRVYGLCSSSAQIQLIDRAGDGVVYGFIGARGVRSVQVGAGSGRALSVRRVSVIGGVFFIRLLPQPACSYRNIGFAWTVAGGARAASGPTGLAPGSRASILILATQRSHGCGPRGALVPTAVIGSSIAGGRQVSLAIAPPRALSGRARTDFLAGEQVVAQAGCLACHRIGASGNVGPGPNLSSIGSQRLSAVDLRRTLVSPKAPMPSFRGLSRARLDAVIAFLQDLRRRHAG